MSKSRSLARSFSFAFSGLFTAVRQEPNFRIHITLGILALILGAILRLTVFEWLLLLFTIAFVTIMELLNTVLEALVDIVSPKKQPKAKIAKDVAAAGVLVSATIALIVGAVLFIPKII